MEHRWGSRTHINETVRIAVASHPFCIARLRDVSASGAFLDTLLQAPYLAHVRLQLHVPRNRRARSCVLEGHVVRNAADGIGIEWLEFSPVSIKNLIQAYSREPRREREAQPSIDARSNARRHPYFR